MIRSETMRMQPALCPDPPQVTVTLVGLEERRQIEKFTCDLVNKRDRLVNRTDCMHTFVIIILCPFRVFIQFNVISKTDWN